MAIAGSGSGAIFMGHSRQEAVNERETGKMLSHVESSVGFPRSTRTIVFK
jgi:hypothetical protein